MKFTLVMKDPDGVHGCVDAAVSQSLADVTDPDERRALYELRISKFRDVLKRWVQFGEYITINIDTDSGTAQVEETKG